MAESTVGYVSHGRRVLYPGRLVRRALSYLVAGKLVFWGSMIGCYVLLPDADTYRHGLSVYGNQRASIVPYTVGLLVSPLLMALAANSMPADERRLSRWLRLVAVLLVALLFTPWRLGPIVRVLHTVVGTTLFIFQLMFGFYLCVRTWPNWLTAALFAVQLMASFITLLSLLDVVYLMFSGQIVALLAFCVLLIVATARILSDRVGSKVSAHGR